MMSSVYCTHGQMNDGHGLDEFQNAHDQVYLI